MQTLASLGGVALVLYSVTSYAAVRSSAPAGHMPPALVLATERAPDTTDGAPQASTFTLADQHNRWHSYHFPRPKVSFLAIADQTGSAQLEAWIEPVYARYHANIEIHGVAAMPAVPEPLRGLVRLFFQNQLAYPVMLDWDSRVAQRYRYQQAQANVFIIDPAGHIRLKMVGAVEPAHLQRVFGVIDQLLRSPGRADQSDAAPPLEP